MSYQAALLAPEARRCHLTARMRRCGVPCSYKYAPPADRPLRRLPRSKEKRLLKTMKFPKEYELKVDLTRVNWEVMKVWIAQRVTELLGVEDDVLIGYVYEQLEGHKASTCSFLHYSCHICSKHMLQTRRTGIDMSNASIVIGTSRV